MSTNIMSKTIHWMHAIRNHMPLQHNIRSPPTTTITAYNNFVPVDIRQYTEIKHKTVVVLYVVSRKYCTEKFGI